MTIERIKRTNGVAGQYQITATISEGTAVSELSFVSSVYGGPIVMVTPSGAQSFVSDPGRFSDSRGFGPLLNEDWVRRFVESGS